MKYIHNIEFLLEVLRPTFNFDIEMYNLKALKLNVIEVI